MANEVEFQIISLLKDLQRRITYLEKKIDTLVSQSTEKSSSAKSYSQAPRTYGGPKRYQDNHETPFGRKNPQTGRSFEKKLSNEGRGFPKTNKTFNPTSKKRSRKSK